MMHARDNPPCCCFQVVGVYFLIMILQPDSPSYYRHIQVCGYYTGALLTVDLALCVMHHYGVKLSRARAVLYVVLCRLAIVPFSVQNWYLVVCAIYVGFALVVGGGVALALYPVQSVRDAVTLLSKDQSQANTRTVIAAVVVVASVTAAFFAATMQVCVRDI
jgi:hypothetical protein